MKPCPCSEPHRRRRIVLTGGPGAGKTAILELIRQHFCVHVKVLPEAAGIVFGGGFPRGSNVDLRRAAQRAIFYVQRELELAADVDDAAIVLCDRGTVDGVAYWPGQGDLWSAVGTTLDEQLERYDAVIHLRTPALDTGYNHLNPLRTESADEAASIDLRIARVTPKYSSSNLHPTSSARRPARSRFSAAKCRSVVASASCQRSTTGSALARNSGSNGGRFRRAQGVARSRS